MNETAVPPSAPSFFHSQARLGILLLLFLALTLVYNAVIPLFEAPDERDHVRYAHWLAEGHGLPHLVTDRPFVGEIWQPPLYYALIAAEQFPYRQTTLAVHLARFVSALLGMITIICTYGIARQIIPRAALIAAALVAFTPQFVFMSAVVNNDNLVIALCSLVLWRTQQRDWGR